MVTITYICDSCDKEINLDKRELEFSSIVDFKVRQVIDGKLKIVDIELCDKCAEVAYELISEALPHIHSVVQDRIAA